MKSLLSVVVVLILASALSLRADVIPVERFAKSPLFTLLRMSPDGEYIAFLHEDEGRTSLYLSDFTLKQSYRIEPGETAEMQFRKDITGYEWITAKRLTFTTTVSDLYWYGVSAVDRDGKRWKPLTGAEAQPHGSISDRLLARKTIHRFHDEHARILMLEQRGEFGREKLYPNVVEVDTIWATVRPVVKNPGNVIGWGADRKGVVRLGITIEGTNYGVIYRESDHAPWVELFAPNPERGLILPLGFDYSNEKIYVAALSDKNRNAVYLLDPAKKEFGQPIFEDPEFDVILGDHVPSVDGTPMYGLIFSDRKKTLVGIRYVTTGPRVVWFDPEFTAIQQTIDQALPGRVNVFTSKTYDEKKFMVLSFSDVDPGSYYVFDPEKRSVKPVGARVPWLKPEELAHLKLVTYQARDGLTIRGYLTLPPGHPPKDLPLVVMPHGGPWVRDVWNCDLFVQFLANRGYAVLQMNYRGSVGYGQELLLKGKHEIGRGIQNDIEDATRWAIEKGIADPSRIAIVGTSYGGFSALFALGKTPDLYRCGISIAGVTDWPDIIKGMREEEYKLSYDYWVEQLGDPKDDRPFLESISPVNFADKIVAPVLIVQGKEDRVVPPKQARLMIAALEKAGRTPEKLFLPYDGHGPTSEKGRVATYTRVESFLREHLGPGVAPTMPVTEVKKK